MLIIGYFVNKWHKKQLERIDRMFEENRMLDLKINDFKRSIENYEKNENENKHL